MNDMPVYEKFEDLPVWKLAKDLAVKIYQITKGEKFRRDYGLVDQIRRASISTCGELAEPYRAILPKDSKEDQKKNLSNFCILPKVP